MSTIWHYTAFWLDSNGVGVKVTMPDMTQSIGNLTMDLYSLYSRCLWHLWWELNLRCRCQAAVRPCSSIPCVKFIPHSTLIILYFTSRIILRLSWLQGTMWRPLVECWDRRWVLDGNSWSSWNLNLSLTTSYKMVPSRAPLLKKFETKRVLLRYVEPVN